MEKGKQSYTLPEGWIWTTIGEISVLSSGGTPSRSNSNYFRGNIPWVKSGELNYNVIKDTEEKITQEALETSSARLVPVNTLLIALYGSTVGKIARLGIEASTNQAVVSIITFSNFNKEFLYYYLFHKETWSNKNEYGRWRKYDYKDLIARDKTNLDIFWLKDDKLIDLENLPEPEILLDEIIDNIESALASFKTIKENMD